MPASGARDPAIPAAEVGPIDAVLLSHDHHEDNLDAAGRALLPSAGTVITTGSGAARPGGGARGLADWESTRLEAPGRPAIEVLATPCRHGPPLSHPIVGDVIGLALRWDGQQHGALWISGDTVLYEVYEGAPQTDDEPPLVTITFAALGERTLLTLLTETSTKELRDAIIDSGIEGGMQEAMDLLEQAATSLR